MRHPAGYLAHGVLRADRTRRPTQKLFAWYRQGLILWIPGGLCRLFPRDAVGLQRCGSRGGHDQGRGYRDHCYRRFGWRVCSNHQRLEHLNYMGTGEAKIEIKNLTMAYGSYVVMRDINAQV